MTQRTQKRHEEHLLKRELDRIGLQYEIVRSGERPDFVLACNGLSIGVEVSEFHLATPKKRGPNLREVEETWLRLIKEIDKTREGCPELDGVDVQIRRGGDSLPSAQAHKDFADAMVECVRNNLAFLPDEGILTLKSVGYPVLMRYVESFAMEHCSFYSSWTIDLDFRWVGVDDNDLLMCMQKKLQQRYGAGSVALWLFVIGQCALSRTMGHLSVSKMKTYHLLNDALEASQYQMVWLCDWNIVRWVRSQGWEQVAALGQKRLDHRASQSAK
jgi:hypothetical protein